MYVCHDYVDYIVIDQLHILSNPVILLCWCGLSRIEFKGSFSEYHPLKPNFLKQSLLVENIHIDTIRPLLLFLNLKKKKNGKVVSGTGKFFCQWALEGSMKCVYCDQ